eukprot:3441540-Prymnesium_polylepis.1
MAVYLRAYSAVTVRCSGTLTKTPAAKFLISARLSLALSSGWTSRHPPVPRERDLGERATRDLASAVRSCGRPESCWASVWAGAGRGAHLHAARGLCLAAYVHGSMN